MANYDRYLYTTDGAQTHPIRISTQTAAVQTTTAVKVSTTSPSQKVSARVSGSARKEGIRARFVSLVREVSAGTGATAVTKKYYTRLPVLVKADFDGYTEGQTVVLGSVTWKVGSGGAQESVS